MRTATKTRKHEKLRGFRAFVLSWLFAVVAVSSAQQQSPAPQQPPTPPGLKSGNPTPGTPQPEPPNPADRVTLTGCLERVPAPTDRSADASRSLPDSNAPSDSRFLLTNVQRRNIVPPDTGTSSAAARSAAKKYRLRGIDSQLSPFVGTQVEISGELVTSGAKSDEEMLLVEFVQKMASKCA